MLRLIIKTYNRRHLQVNGTEDQKIVTLDFDNPEIETYLRDYDDGWQSHRVLGVELSEEPAEQPNAKD